MVRRKSDKKYSVTSLPIFNIEGDIEAETPAQYIFVINTITKILKKYYILENKCRKKCTSVSFYCTFNFLSIVIVKTNLK